MNFFQAIVLGIVQGITEFLPISSSAHLVITRQFFGIVEQESFLLFDAILHLATALVITVYFFDDIKKIFRPLLKKTYLSERAKSFKLLFLIATASIPAIIVGFTLEDFITRSLRGIGVIIVTLVVGALLLFVAEKISKRSNRGSVGNLPFWKAFIIGCFQMAALIPGVSRSGSTLSGGVFMGLSKIEATRFAFLLGLPVLYGVGGIKLIQSFSEKSIDFGLIFAGSVTAIISGYLSMKFLMYVVKKQTLNWFVGYRLILAAILSVFLMG